MKKVYSTAGLLMTCILMLSLACSLPDIGAFENADP